MLDVTIWPLSTIFLLGFGTVPIVWYFIGFHFIPKLRTKSIKDKVKGGTHTGVNKVKVIAFYVSTSSKEWSTEIIIII